MFVMLLDMPLLVLFKPFKKPPYEVRDVTVLGTIGWLCVGIVFVVIFEWFKRRKALKTIQANR